MASNHDKDAIDSIKDRANGTQQKAGGTNDIEDFYNQLLVNNLSTTKIEVIENDQEL